MPRFRFPTDIGRDLEAYVSRLLDKAEAPGFVWAEPYLTVLLVPTSTFFSGWVVADDCIERASRALDKAKFPPCTQGEECWINSEYLTHPRPDYHYHTDERYANMPCMTKGVFLYKKSRLFWSFPDPPISRPAPDDPYYTLTSDTRLPEPDDIELSRGRGRAPTGKYPVKMLIPARYIEGILLLHLRDLKGMMTTRHWLVELYYLGHYVLGAEDNSAATIGNITEPFQKFFQLRARDKGRYPSDSFFHQLYGSPKSNGQLPPPEGMAIEKYWISLEQRLQGLCIPFNEKILED